MPTTRKQSSAALDVPVTAQEAAASTVPEAAPERRLARPRAVADGVREAAERLVRTPHDIAHAQYELARQVLGSAVVVDVDVNVDVDVASRQTPSGV